MVRNDSAPRSAATVCRAVPRRGGYAAQFRAAGAPANPSAPQPQAGCQSPLQTTAGRRGGPAAAHRCRGAGPQRLWTPPRRCRGSGGVGRRRGAGPTRARPGPLGPRARAAPPPPPPGPARARRRLPPLYARPARRGDGGGTGSLLRSRDALRRVDAVEGLVKIRNQDLDSRNSRLLSKGRGKEATQPMRKRRRSPASMRPCPEAPMRPCSAWRVMSRFEIKV